MSKPTRSRLRWRTACCASWSPRPTRPSPSASRSTPAARCRPSQPARAPADHPRVARGTPNAPPRQPPPAVPPGALTIQPERVGPAFSTTRLLPHDRYDDLTGILVTLATSTPGPRSWLSDTFRRSAIDWCVVAYDVAVLAVGASQQLLAGGSPPLGGECGA